MAMRSYTRCRPQVLASARKFLTLVLIVPLSLYFLQGAALADPGKNQSGESDRVYPPPEKPATSHQHSGSDKQTLGETVYKHMCVFCHGEDGNGGGKAMAYLYPWPRDFRKGVFKHRSTPTGSLPLDEDIYQTIARGVPGTSMPAWGTALTEDETRSVVQYIKKFSQRFSEEKPKDPVVIQSVPPTTEDEIKKGKALFKELRCSRCHGTDLKGGGANADDLYRYLGSSRVYLRSDQPQYLQVRI